MMCNASEAQTTLRGVSAYGITIEDRVGEEKLIGLATAHVATKGVILGVSTNVQAWHDLTGNEYNLRQYNPTNQPSYIFFGTNMFGDPVKAIFFETNAPYLGAGHLRSDRFAPLMSGVDKPFTWIIVVNSQMVGGAHAVNIGLSSAPNGNASQMGFRENNFNSTSELFVRSSDTNTSSTIPTIVLAGGTATNNWKIETITFDGTTATYFNNLFPFTTTNMAFGVASTFNQFTVGARRRNSGILDQKWRGAIAENWIYTNIALTGLQVTNKVNEINLRNGRFF